MNRKAALPVSAVAGIVLVTVLVVWAATSGPGDVFRGRGIQHTYDNPTPTAASQAGEPAGPLDDVHAQAVDHGFIRVIAIVLEFLLGLWLVLQLILGLRWARQMLHRRRRRREKPLDVPFDVLDDPDLLIDALVLQAERQHESLLEGEPRNAIVRCWHEFETAADSVGLHRHPWETSSEFTLRALELAGADPEPVMHLGILYREARFSDHEVTEVHRAEAVEALGRLMEGLRSRGGSRRVGR